MGVPGSGKTTLAQEVAAALADAGVDVHLELLDVFGGRDVLRTLKYLLVRPVLAWKLVRGLRGWRSFVTAGSLARRCRRADLLRGGHSKKIAILDEGPINGYGIWRMAGGHGSRVIPRRLRPDLVVFVSVESAVAAPRTQARFDLGDARRRSSVRTWQELEEFAVHLQVAREEFGATTLSVDGTEDPRNNCRTIARGVMEMLAARDAEG